MSDTVALAPAALAALDGALPLAGALPAAVVPAAAPAEDVLLPVVFLLDEQPEMTTKTEHAATASCHWRLVVVTFIAKSS
ncbi:MAG TPA: hypothetical protein VIJ96_03900 [Acidothermaceae bacterium]